LIRLIEAKDVEAKEVIVGGKIAKTPYGNRLRELNVTVYEGIKEAKDEAKKRLAKIEVKA
jgi:CRISPR-associated protein Cst2